MPWQDAPVVEGWQAAPVVDDDLARIDALMRGEQRGISLEEYRARHPSMLEAVERSVVRNVGQPFNRGLVNLVALPGDLASALTGGATDLGAESLRGTARRFGMIEPEGQESTGVIPRASEIAGASVLPMAGIMTRGAQVLRTIPEQARSVAQRIFAGAAQRPGLSAGGEAVASLGAGTGGEVAAQFTEDPAIQALGELAGGLTPLAATIGPTGQLVRRVPGMVRDAAFPFTEAGGNVRAARRLQSLAADPEGAAESVGQTPELSPARQTGDPRLLALERTILESDPALEARAASELAAGRQQLQQQAALGGDTEAPRAALRTGVDRAVQRVNQRLHEASRRALNAVMQLDPNASPREASRIAREHIDRAHDAARSAERTLWSAVDQSAPASVSTARASLQSEIASRTRFDDPNDIPGWLRKSILGDEDELPDWAQQLVQSGRGRIVASESAEPSTLGDVHSIRSRVLNEIREERSKSAPNRNKVRILERVQEALLEDMGASNAGGLDDARAFSRSLNDRFTTGRIGQLRGYERPGAPRVDPQDTFEFILSGRGSAASVRQMIEAAPETRGEFERFLKGSFLAQAVDDKGVNAAAADRFISRWKNKGIFEIYPDLESELRNVTSLQQGARRLGIRADRVQRLAHHSDKSRAALYLNAPPGEEMQHVLRAKSPTAVARSLTRRMGGDSKARNGLKSAFVEELMRQSTSAVDEAGAALVSGSRFSRLLSQYKNTAQAFGMTDQELARLNNIANRLRLAEQNAGRMEKIVEDTPSQIVDLMARWIGAQSGQRLGSGLGSSLVLAQAGSSKLRNALQRLTRDRAREILIAAHRDPELYRSLLTRTTDPAAKQDKAARTLQAWTVGVADVDERNETQ